MCAFTLLILVLPALGQENPSSKRPVLLILGDSLSAGFRVSQTESWPNLLNDRFTELNKQHLQNAEDQDSIFPSVINGSISGDTAEQALQRLPSLLENYQPDYVLIELGANDGMQGLDLNGLKKSLSEIISLVQKQNAQPILMQINIPQNLGKRYVTAFKSIYPTLAEQYTIDLLPFYMEDLVLENSTTGHFLQEDNIHPTDLAQPWIADWMLEYLTPLLTLNKK